MSFLEVVKEAKQLRMSEQLQLIEELLRSLRGKIATPGEAAGDAAPMSSLRGALKPDNGVLPTNDEVDALIADYLLEKHA